MPLLRLLAIAAFAGTVVLSAAPAGADQVLQEVTPGNGDSLDRAPDEVVLTFAEPLVDTSVAVTVTTPEGRTDVQPRVEGRSVTVQIDDGGPGQYVVAYALEPGPARGETGFTVLKAGESAPEQPAPSAWWQVAFLVLLAGLVVALVGTVLRWRRS